MNQIDEQFSLVPFGVDVLAMSKRIMNEVMCLAYDNDCAIYYQDTDSLHIEMEHIEKLKKVYYEKYNRNLEGKDMGQFHSDFKKLEKDAENPHSEEMFILGKKAYCHRLVDNKGNTKPFYRLKGISSSSIEQQADLYFNGCIYKVYEYLYKMNKKKYNKVSLKHFNPKVHITKDEEKIMTFDLVTKKKPCFKAHKNLQHETLESFPRFISFSLEYGVKEKYFNYAFESSDS